MLIHNIYLFISIHIEWHAFDITPWKMGVVSTVKMRDNTLIHSDKLIKTYTLFLENVGHQVITLLKNAYSHLHPHTYTRIYNRTFQVVLTEV